jgi:hypothetical protein
MWRACYSISRIDAEKISGVSGGDAVFGIGTNDGPWICGEGRTPSLAIARLERVAGRIVLADGCWSPEDE